MSPSEKAISDLRTAEQLALAKALLVVGVVAIDPARWALRSLDEVWENASASNQTGIMAVAHHVLVHFIPRHDYAPAHGGGK